MLWDGSAEQPTSWQNHVPAEKKKEKSLRTEATVNPVKLEHSQLLPQGVEELG